MSFHLGVSHPFIFIVVLWFLAFVLHVGLLGWRLGNRNGLLWMQLKADITFSRSLELGICNKAVVDQGHPPSDWSSNGLALGDMFYSTASLIRPCFGQCCFPDVVLSFALFLPQERLKANEQRVDMEEKVTKRSLDSAKSGLSSSAPGLVHRKPPVLSPSASTSYSKAVSPPPLSPRASPVSVLKAEVIQKMEEPPSQPAYSYPATPSSHPSSPPPASPPPAPAIPPKEEAPETVEKKDLELEKEAAGPYQALFPGKRALLWQSPVVFVPASLFLLGSFLLLSLPLGKAT